MREDMKKVLCERPRAGSAGCYKEVRRHENRGDLENLPKYQGMRRPYKAADHQKNFTDHIMPLKRYLDGCVGRSFNDVWSEVCEAVPSNNTIDQHLKGHVLDDIFLNTRMMEGELWGTLGSRLYKVGDWYSESMYVDEDGIIRLFPKKPRVKKEELKNYVRLNKYEDAHLIFGIWYKFSYSIVPDAKMIEYVDENGETKTKKLIESRKDLLTRRNVYSGEVYACTKNQMRSKELKHHGLQNEDSKI